MSQTLRVRANSGKGTHADRRSAFGDQRLAATDRPLAGTERFLRSRLLERLSSLRHGLLVIQDAHERVVLGEAGDSADALAVHIEVLDSSFYRLVALNGSVGAAESYMEGQWRCDNLVALIRLIVRNRALLDGLETGPAQVGAWLLRVWHSMRRNTRSGSARNIAAHYDLGNEFFRLFLSPDLMYSSAWWEGDNDTLEAASARKLDRVCRRLNLEPTDRVVEIGSGWGGFALHAADRYGCHVTTTTISREQFAMAAQLVKERGLEDRVSVILSDYRDLHGSYDKLVSIEMIEAVGHQYLETYFAKAGSLVRPGGLALIQAITIEDHRYAQALAAVDFIKRHIFPGSFIPSIQAMLTAKMRACDLALVQLEDFGLSYARTLQAWREAFLARLPHVQAQGFDDRFIRMWEFYLAYCEGGFREQSLGVSHLLFKKPGLRL
jgi:cyclopropane-fatty-acyl-phospholipid synthase